MRASLFIASFKVYLEVILEAHSGLSRSSVTTTSTTGANTSSLNSNTTSAGSSSSKR
jgi:hypothetical protein